MSNLWREDYGSITFYIDRTDTGHVLKEKHWQGERCEVFEHPLRSLDEASFLLRELRIKHGVNPK